MTDCIICNTNTELSVCKDCYSDYIKDGQKGYKEWLKYERKKFKKK